MQGYKRLLTLNPTLEQCKLIVQRKNVKYIPVTFEIHSDNFTPINILKKLKRKSKRCFLLESAEHDKHFGRWSILGFDPKFEITLNDGVFKIEGLRKDSRNCTYSCTTSDPNSEIKKLLEDYKSHALDSIPFTGGLVGCFSYDYFRYSEPVLREAKLENGDFFDLDLLLFDKVVAFDHYKQKLIIIANIPANNIEKNYIIAEKNIKKILKLVSGRKEAKFKKLKLSTALEAQFSAQRFKEMVEKAKKYIYEGDIFQVVLSNPMRAEAEGSLFNAYRILRSTNPSPYMFYLTSQYTEIVGASPETLVSMHDRVMHTYPLAGTRKRGEDAAEDQRLEKELLADEKECSEHNMLVDLGRNDIGKVAKISSVNVTKYMEVVKYSHVMHIASEVQGEILPDKGPIDALSAILPAGTLSGAPKIRACQIIDELEGVKRGIYGGAIGYIDFQGNLDTAIAIRLAYKKNGVVTVQSGAGIVADSVPEKEAEECRNKAMAVINALTESQEDLE